MISKRVLRLLNIFLMISASLSAQEKTYYLSASGNDANDGLSIHTAWRTLEKINNIHFKPGDSLLFEGGTVFNGTIKLTSDDNGSPARAVVFTSYGKSKAIINAGGGEGLLALNTSFFKLVSLKFEGAGVDKTNGSGIHFYANDSVNAPSNIEIVDCDARGFHTYGIGIGANENISYKGYENVRITHCNTSENGQAGIASYGSLMGFQHRNFYLANCKVFKNRGILTKTQNHSGNGIVMGMVDGLLIEHCEAYENGADNRSTAGGPVGIWVWMCKNAVIQYCVSHDNYAGLTKDGGGFDIDGGASNCILQYNYSYNNEGAGFLLAEYGALFPFTNNTIRFNISVNDGRKNGYGAITVWGAAKEHRVTNTYVYNNTIFLDHKKIINGKPAGITLLGLHFENVIIANNIITTAGDVNMLSADTVISASAILLLHNNYYSYSNHYSFQWGKKAFSSVQSWLQLNQDQEKWQGKFLWMNINPMFIDQKLLINSTTGNTGEHFRKNRFNLLPASRLRQKLFQLRDHFTIHSNTKDYNNNDLPVGTGTIPGAVTQ